MSALIDELNKQIPKINETTITDTEQKSDAEIKSENNACEALSNLQKEIEKQVKASVPTPVDATGHIYPIAMIQAWTKEMQGYNQQLEGYVISFKQIDFKKADKTWVRKQIEKFVKWINERLKKLREKIVKALKAMMAKIKDVLALIEPLLKLPSLTTVITWVSNVIKLIMRPYEKIITFIQDFAKYTPPLIQEGTTLATNAAQAPVLIQQKAAELEGEAAEEAKKEINSNVSQVGMESISMGDIM